MKIINYIIAVAFLLVFAACQKPFEKTYGLEVDSNEYVVPITGKTFPVYVYCSSAWTAELDTPADWATIIEGNRGEGVGMVKVNVLPNYGEARSVNLILRSGSYEQVIVIRQNVFAVDYYVTFDEREPEIAAGSYLLKTRMTTNIPPEVLASSRASADVDWISGITSYNVLSDNQVIGTNRKIEVEFSFVVLANGTGESRTAVFSPGVPAEYTEGMERVQSLTLVQTGEVASISAVTPQTYSSLAQDCQLLLASNLRSVSSDMIVSASVPFVNKARIETTGESMYLKFTLLENETGNQREASITVSYRDLKNNLTGATINIHQN